MKKHHINIDDETMAVLRSSSITATTVKLPTGKLARPLYMKVNKVLETAGGKWSKSQKAHIFTDDPRSALGLAVEKGAILDRKKSTQAFYTPTEVAALVVALASVQGKTVLEPSAGHGSLADRCREGGASQVVCIEHDPQSCEVLIAKGFHVIEGDFLKQSSSLFDRVVMNPPFTAGQDIDHVAHAFDFLKPGGRLVAIMSPAWFTGTQKKQKAMQLFLAQYGYVAERLDAGAFKESGTGIATMVVVLNKP